MFGWGLGGVWDLWDDPACLGLGTSPGALWHKALDQPLGRAVDVEEEQPPGVFSQHGSIP